MKILIVDTTAEGQARCAERIEQFSRSERDALDLRLKLVSDRDVLERLGETDVVIFGSGVGEGAIRLARECLRILPWLQILLFVTEDAYGSGSFRTAHSAGVRKVFPDSADPLDLLQELVAISAEFRRTGRTREGTVVICTHGKGGVGTTSLAAALGEVSTQSGRRTLLWDFDVETRDLSRGLLVNGDKGRVLGSWISGTTEFRRHNFEEAVAWINDTAAVLAPPVALGEALDLVSHPDVVDLISQMLEAARSEFDTVLCDTGGRLGPFLGALLRAADTVLLVTDDSGLGITATDIHLGVIAQLLTSIERLFFVVAPLSDTYRSHARLATEFYSTHQISESAWVLPPVFFDPRASDWAGSSKTLYSLGSKATRATLEEVARLARVSSMAVASTDGHADEVTETPKWLPRLLRNIPGR